MASISIIIPAYNEEKDIGDCIKSLQNQSFKDFEIIVVDDGSTDKTREVVKSFKEAKLIQGEHKGPGFSRNLGAKQAKGKILIFVDADMTFDKDYLKNLVKPIQKNKKIIGTIHDYEIATNTKNIWSRCWGKYRVLKEGADIQTIFRAICKDKFFQLGCFDPRYGYADDQTFWLKYKIRPFMAENATCFHKNPETLKQVYKQSRWIGASLSPPLINLPIIKYFMPLAMIIGSPLVIPYLSIKRCHKNHDFKTLIPWMLIFMTLRYLGTISGLFRKIYLDKNVR